MGELSWFLPGSRVISQSEALLHIYRVRAGDAACAFVGMTVAQAPWFPKGHESGRVGRYGLGTIVCVCDKCDKCDKCIFGMLRHKNWRKKLCN
jgi:hypothetical protein